MKILSSKSREWLAKYWPYIVAAVMIAYVIALVFLTRTDIEETSQILRQP